MNFKSFNHFYKETGYDEIKVIGKELQKEGKPYHIIGMTLKEKRAYLYVLELTVALSERELWREKTPRESLKDNMESDRNSSFFMHIREFRCGEKVYETAGATSGAIGQGDFAEAYMLFIKMYEAGWRITEESAFMHVPWENIAVTKIELRDECEELPEWKELMEVLVVPVPTNESVEKPVVLECGKTAEIEFFLKDRSPAICYINKVELIDVWADQEKKFAEDSYREKMLQHMSEEEFEQMKEQFWKVLEQHCPRGKHFMAIEYECSEDVVLSFYDKEYLDTIPKPSEGSASAVFMRVKPEKEKGTHGYKLQGCVIQKPLDEGEGVLEAELFSYTEMVQKRVEKVGVGYRMNGEK